MKTRAVYMIKNTINGKRYIGQTNQPEIRQRQHMKAWSRCLALAGAVKAHGPEAFHFRVLAVGMNRSEADDIERAMIARLGTIAPHGYNLTEGGEGGRPTPEGCLKISISKKGKPMTNAILASVASRRGKPLRQETIRKISEYRTRWHQDPDNKRRHSEAVKAGMARKSHKGGSSTP
jgi:group I intron endonuclease